MILLRFLALFTILFLAVPGTGHAQLNALQSKVFGGDRSNPDFVRPGLQDGKTYGPAAKDEWSPDEWTQARGSQQEVINGFYRNHILVGQSLDGKTPVIEVGDHFMKLSSRDKNRVAEYLDTAYSHTAATGMFYVHYRNDKKPFGVYTKSGLTLQ